MNLKNEPVLALAVVVAIALGVFGVVVDTDTVYNVLVVALPLVVGLLQRANVIPVNKLPAPVKKVAEVE